MSEDYYNKFTPWPLDALNLKKKPVKLRTPGDSVWIVVILTPWGPCKIGTSFYDDDMKAAGLRKVKALNEISPGKHFELREYAPRKAKK